MIPGAILSISVPDEPEIGSVVRDSDGDLWTRVSQYGWHMSEYMAPNPSVSDSMTWEYLLQYGPLTVVRIGWPT